ncbi:MAG TPA: tetratricopeptide repeat protein [Planctomycetaceae bacterium]|nr:tetratricopeptide repeat protein [Planctomycetaceae bacterium]
MIRLSTVEMRGLVCWIGMATAALAQGATPESAKESKAIEETPPAQGLRFQDLDDTVERLKPIKARTAADEARLDATAWFATARLMQERGDLPAALRSYRRAIESDPTAVAAYREGVRLAIELKKLELAVPWARKLVELEPGNLQSLISAVTLLMNLDDKPGAIQLLELGVKAPGLDRATPQYVLLMRQLAILYVDADRKEDAIPGFEILFDALTHPEKYKLDVRARTQLQSDADWSYEKIGQFFLDVKKTDLALAAFQKAAESKKGPAVVNLSYNLAQVYLQAGEGEKALEEIQKYIDSQRQSKGRAAYELLVAILDKLGRSQEAIRRLEEAATKDPRNSTLQYFLADQYAAANRLDEAEELFKKTLDSSAETQGYVGLAAVYRRKGKPAELIDALGKGYLESGDLASLARETKAIIGDEKLLSALLEIGAKRLDEQPPALDFAAGYVLANLAADGKRTEVAERLYRYLLSIRKERAVLLYEELGQLLNKVRKYAEASKVYQEAVDDPAAIEGRPKFMFVLGFTLQNAGETKKALEANAAAQQMLPNNPLVRNQEAWIYYDSRQYEEAIPRFEKLIADFPQPQAREVVRSAQSTLSNIYVLQGDVRKGLEILESIYKENPNEISINNDLGYLYADHGMNLEQAEVMIRKAVTAEPENAAYLDSMGWVLFKLGKPDEALPYLEKSVRISTSRGDEALHDHLGDVYDRLQQPAKAVEAWKKALELSRESAYPDKKLIDRVEEKLKNHKEDPGKLKPAKPGAP